MIIAARLADRIKELNLSHSDVARAVGVKQPTISRLVKGDQYSTTRIRKLAEVLRTTPAYLEGIVDDPDEGAPPPPPVPAIQYVTMQIALPPEPALAEMFEGLLSGIDELPKGELARHLARRLPTGLSRMRDLLPADWKAASARSLPSEPIPVPSPR